MIISRTWLAEYFEKPIPDAKTIADLFTFHTFEIESIEGDMIDVKILPDRAHYALCHRGIAYELSPLINQPLKNISFSLPNSENTKPLTIEVLDKSFCKRYMGLFVENVNVSDSPDWLKKKLESIGQRPINSVVDITNFVMFDIGQPMHAFDADKIVGKIIVRGANEGESVELLPERVVLNGNIVEKPRNIILKKTDYVIADEMGPVAIAGVKGGVRAQVTKETKNIIFEAAHFDPVSIRKTSVSYDIRNDSSKRFENEISSELAKEGMERASSLVKEICPSARFGNVVDVNNGKEVLRTIDFNIEIVSRVLGIEISKNKIISILESLAIEVQDVGDFLKLTIPSFRLDLVIPEDVVEEIGRINGYEHIPGKSISETKSKPVIHKGYYYAEKIRENLINSGFSEVYTYGLASGGYFEIIKSASDKNFVRENLFGNIKEAIARNVPNAPLLGIDIVQIFEIGKVFPKSGEKTELAIGVFDTISKGKKNEEILKKTLKSLEEILGISFDKKIQIKEGVAVIDFDALIKILPEVESYDVHPEKREMIYKKISIYPFVLRDIAVWVPENISASELGDLLQKEAGDLLANNPRLVDEYKKDGRISYAFRLVFQSYEKTLTDVEVNKIMEKINKAISIKGWEVR